jgi:hypothetical protein
MQAYDTRLLTRRRRLPHRRAVRARALFPSVAV